MKRALLVVAVLALATASAALATKPGSGSSLGTARVFVPNPVQDLGDQSLTDQKDADYPALAPAYRTVALTHLDGSGYLSGDYATIVGSTGNLAYSPTNTFLYDRHQDEFEQVMAYYWITQAQEYIQSLGFGSGGRSRRSTRSRSGCASTSGASTTRSRPRTRTRCASARAASTTPRTPR